MRSFCVSYSGQSQQVLTVLWTTIITRSNREVWRHVTMVAKCLFLNNPLDRDSHLHCRMVEEEYRLPFCSWVQSCTGKSYLSVFSFFLAGPRFVDATPWQRDVTTFSLYCTWLVPGAGKRMWSSYGCSRTCYWWTKFSKLHGISIYLPIQKNYNAIPKQLRKYYGTWKILLVLILFLILN